MVEVRIYGPLREHVDEREFEWPQPSPPTVLALLESLGEEYPDLATRLFDDQNRPRDAINVLLDGVHVDDLADTELAEDAQVSIAPPLEGGCR